MPKLDPYKLRRSAPLIETRTFTDAANPGVELALTLRVLRELPFRVGIEAAVAENIRVYVTGVGEDGKPLLDVSGRPIGPQKIKGVTDEAGSERGIVVGEQVCRFISLIEQMQMPPDGEEPYTFAELAALSVTMYDAMIEAGFWANSLLMGTGEKAGGATAEEAAANP